MKNSSDYAYTPEHYQKHPRPETAMCFVPEPEPTKSEVGWRAASAITMLVMLSPILIGLWVSGAVQRAWSRG